jgi:hypothetical protein
MSVENLNIYNKARVVPKEAQKEIGAGRLKGKTDINPMWRIKLLTELFGVCGFGWKYEITKQWTEQGANNEISAFVNINLHVKMNDQWSDAIPGTGGSSFVANERNGAYTSDECFKMALTDAISVSCKALGVGADVYWDKDSTKYDSPKNDLKGDTAKESQSNANGQASGKLSDKQVNRAIAIGKGKGISIATIKQTISKDYGKTEIADLTKDQYDELCTRLENAGGKK